MLRSEFLFPTLFAHVLKDISERMLDQLLSTTINRRSKTYHIDTLSDVADQILLFNILYFGILNPINGMYGTVRTTSIEGTSPLRQSATCPTQADSIFLALPDEACLMRSRVRYSTPPCTMPNFIIIRIVLPSSSTQKTLSDLHP
jgi:hypothetical protein